MMMMMVVIMMMMMMMVTIMMIMMIFMIMIMMLMLMTLLGRRSCYRVLLDDLSPVLVSSSHTAPLTAVAFSKQGSDVAATGSEGPLRGMS
jgi:hypothetical protein